MPPPLELDDPDAGVSSPPVITDNVAPAEFRFPGPITLFRNNPPTQMETRTFVLSLFDLDVEDTLFVRMYVDYSLESPEKATNFLSDCVASVNGTTTRQASCPAAPLCNTVMDSADHPLEVVVADREFIPSGDMAAEGQPPFRAVKPGGSPPVVRAWLMRCVD